MSPDQCIPLRGGFPNIWNTGAQARRSWDIDPDDQDKLLPGSRRLGAQGRTAPVLAVRTVLSAIIEASAGRQAGPLLPANLS
eukprot:1340028-Amphidinium_carterae.1